MPRLELAWSRSGSGRGPTRRHLAAQHVDHVRHLVDREAAQDAADARDARVVADLEQRPARLVRGLERGLLALGALDHRPELEHPERLLAEADPRCRRRRPARARSTFTSRAIRARAAAARITISAATTTSNVRFTAQSAPARIGGRSSNSGRPWPGTYSPRSTSSSVVRGATRTLHAAPVRRLDDLEQLLLAQAAVGDDQLVELRRARAARVQLGPGPRSRPRSRSRSRRGSSRASRADAPPARGRRRAAPAAARRASAGTSPSTDS